MDVRGATLDRVVDDGVDQLDDRRGVGRDTVDSESLLAVLLLLHELDAEVLGRLVENALGGLGLLEDLLDLPRRPDTDLDRGADCQLHLVHRQDVRRVGHDHHDRLAAPMERDEVVAQHDVDGELAKQLRVDAVLREVVELEPQRRGK